MRIVSLIYLKRHDYIFYGEMRDWITWIDYQILSKEDSYHSLIIVEGIGITGVKYNASATLCCGDYEDITEIEYAE